MLGVIGAVPLVAGVFLLNPVRSAENEAFMVRSGVLLAVQVAAIITRLFVERAPATPSFPSPRFLAAA